MEARARSMGQRECKNECEARNAPIPRKYAPTLIRSIVSQRPRGRDAPGAATSAGPAQIMRSQRNRVGGGKPSSPVETRETVGTPSALFLRTEEPMGIPKQGEAKQAIIVAGVDLVDRSEAVLATASKMAAGATGGELHVVHVIPS